MRCTVGRHGARWHGERAGGTPRAAPAASAREENGRPAGGRGGTRIPATLLALARARDPADGGQRGRRGALAVARGSDRVHACGGHARLHRLLRRCVRAGRRCAGAEPARRARVHGRRARVPRLRGPGVRVCPSGSGLACVLRLCRPGRSRRGHGGPAVLRPFDSAGARGLRARTWRAVCPRDHRRDQPGSRLSVAEELRRDGACVLGIPCGRRAQPAPLYRRGNPLRRPGRPYTLGPATIEEA